MRLFLAFLAWPLLEIALFVWIGGAIGVWATLLWVLGTGILGGMVMRFSAAQGAIGLQAGMRQIRSRDVGTALAGGLFGMISGFLLILPGFATDALGLVLLLPPVQRTIARAAMARTVVMRRGTAHRGSTVVDGEWEEVRPEPPRGLDGPRRPSGWTEGDGH